MFNIPFYDINIFTPFLPPNCSKPPTLYQIMNSIVNGDKPKNEYEKNKNLPKLSRQTIFDFDYPLSDKVSKEQFETMILKHFYFRRIAFDTVTAFRIKLDVKLNEIMPKYNLMFEALDGWQIFEDGKTIEKEGVNNRKSNINSKTNLNSENENISDRRNSDTPQDHLQDVKNGEYVTNYNFDTNTNKTNTDSNSNSNSTDDNTYKEKTIIKDNVELNKIQVFKNMQEKITNIYSLIFKDLECLFYQIVD